MATKVSDLRPIQIAAGVEPSTDRTAASTPHYTMSDKIRFRNGYPEKLGGWLSSGYEYDNFPGGIARSMFSALIGNNVVTCIGTHTDFYSLIGQRLTNVTPLSTTTTTIANSIETDYVTLGANPLAVTLNSGVITVTDPNVSRFVRGDSVTLSGATDTGGILAATINTAHVIRTIGTGVYTIQVGTLASSNATGGGAAVVSASGLLTFSATAHGQANGDRVKITLAADSGGILAATINTEFVIRNVAANFFGVMASTAATSHVTAAGGASTAYQKQIASGSKDESFGQGYGMGLYGVGLYGTALLSSAGRRYPRIWFMDRFADRIIATPGNQGGVYIWDGSNAAAPALISGAPSAVNYAFVSDNILVTFGADNINNRIKASDQGDATGWTGSATNQVFADDVEGAGRLTSHAPVNGINLIFTENQTYTFRYIGLPLIWDIELLGRNVGLIAPMARVVVNGVAYWMGKNNFYRWSGGNIEIIPSSTRVTSTILRYVFKNLTGAQRSKIFCWYNELFDEIWWHYPAAGSNECDRIARFNVTEQTWCPDTMDRTCAEYPNQLLTYHRLLDSSGILYNHETGTDNDAVAMPWSLTTNKMTDSKANMLLSGITPDSAQGGNINVLAEGFRYPQSTAKMYSNNYTIAPETEHVSTSGGARYWQFTLSGNALGQSWLAGNWNEYLQESARQ